MESELAELRTIVDKIRSADERFGHFAAMRKDFPGNEASPAALLADLAGLVHEATEAAKEK